MTSHPLQLAVVTSDGSLTTCTEAACVATAGFSADSHVRTRTLAHGSSTTKGKFTCVSRKTGTTCTASGRGFTISPTGIHTAST